MFKQKSEQIAKAPDTAAILRLSSDVEKVKLADGTLILKRRSLATYLAVPPRNYDLLTEFNGERTVQDVLVEQLKKADHIAISDFHDLVACAHQRGFLLPAGLEEAETRKTLSPTPWILGWNPKATLLLTSILIAMGIPSLALSPSTIPMKGIEWLILLGLCIILTSLGNFSQACVLRGYGRQVYKGRFSFSFGLPSFRVDVRDGLMGGRVCECLLALQGIALASATAFLASINKGNGYFLFFAKLFILCLASPFGPTPAHRFIHAFFRRSHDLPKYAATFLGKKALKSIFFSKKSSHEEKYLIAYSIYAIAWLGMVLHFGAGIIQRQGGEVLDNMLFAPNPGDRLVALLIVLGLLAAVLIPIFYQLFLLGRNVYTLLLPFLTSAEAKIRRKKTADRPSQQDVEEFLANTLLFKNLPEDTIRKIGENLTFATTKPGTVLIREGDRGDTLFLVYSGQVEICKEDEAGRQLQAATLGVSDSFGEIALLDDVPRTASARCLTSCQLLMLTKRDFDEYLLSSLGKEQVRLRIQVCAFLRRHELFSIWTDASLLELAQKFSRNDVPTDTVVLDEGQDNETFYLVYEGTFKVVHNEKELCTLKTGDYFGEISLLRGIRTTTRVISTSPARCLTLSKEDFLAFVSQELRGGVLIENMAKTRLSGVK